MIRPSEDRTDPDGSDDEPGTTFSPIRIINLLLRHRVRLVGLAVVGLLAGLVLFAAKAAEYEAVIRFVVSPGSTRAIVGGGGDLGPVQQRDPFDYYASLLTSSEVRDMVLDMEGPDGRKFSVKGADGRTMREILGIAAGATVQQARIRVSTAAPALEASNRRTMAAVPVLSVRASWTDPNTAADLANAFFDALAKYDQNIRSSAARERANFISAQVILTEERLKKAENDLKILREQNRLLTVSPSSDPDAQPMLSVPPKLALMRDQLQREVTVQSELFLELKKGLDQARILELDQSSSLVMIERASRGVRGGPSLLSYLVVGVMLGLGVGVGLIVMSEARQLTDLSSPDGQELVAHLATVRRDWHLLRTRAAQALSADARSDSPSEKRDA